MTTATTPAAGGTDVQPVSRMVWRLTGLPPLPDPETDAADRLAGLRVLLVNGDPGTAAAVERELKGHGALVHRGAGGAPADAVVDLAMDPAPAGGQPAGAWDEALTETVAALRGVYEDWAEESDARRLFYLAVTHLGGGMGQHARDEPAQPLGGIWAGLAKTLHREFPNCNARVVDVDDAARADLPAVIAAELGRTGPIEVGRRGGARLTLTPVEAPVGPPAVPLGPGDTVLISGGARGIGWRLARELAGRDGAHVVVTGREPFPTGEEPWWGLDEEGWRAFERETWRLRDPGTPPARVRAGLARTRRQWEVATHLTAARREGLAVEYAQCDITDPAQVRDLVRRHGARLAGVIHNAGVDSAARLPRTTDEEIRRTVRTKIDGFLNLFEEVRRLPLRFFCSVGSLTGRLGGMVGQLGYAAANEGLARLGTWAARRADFPVMTLAWPTWDRVGLIANFSAALRYMPALDVTEGLARWRAELLAGSRGEVTFVGPLGKAIDPGQATGYPVVPALPGYAAAFPRIFHLGATTAFTPHARLTTTVTFERERVPVAGDFHVDGVPALPLSVLLESAARGAEWVVPQDFPTLRLNRIEGVVVPAALLRFDRSPLRLVREAEGAHEGDAWVVRVRFRRAGDAAGGGREASVRLVFGDGAPAVPAALPDVPRTTTWRSGSPYLRWRSTVVPLGVWTRDASGRHVAEVAPCAPGDLWVTPHEVPTVVPVAPLENLLRLWAGQGGPLSVTSDPLVIGQLALHADQRGPCRIEGDAAVGVWRVTCAHTGEPVMTVHGPPGPLGGPAPG
ncbi:SDR family NAD(P)-dependent oxidoreductase [Streptomyces marincola]|uniref:SDR family NAD(P)-dependent oxidoreductase n=1 Tax=Streptomyces marincola TaxID=2878388 RepID=UPI001CF20B17|nr:SDR family NAD(P)-dependent oxidoreductase [Streptomyces marincola]UCM87921.1 SDR family NAD(P)-dependent oxidoreductase [Streptomyces marincola]